MLSDVFTDKAQFEWMLSMFLNIHRSHPAEDELTMQYLVVGICKAAAVVGLVSWLYLRNIILWVYSLHDGNTRVIFMTVIPGPPRWARCANPTTTQVSELNWSQVHWSQAT